MEQVPIIKIESENEKQFRQKLEDLFKRVKAVTIDLLIKENPNLNRVQVESYLNSRNGDLLNDEKEWKLIGLLDSIVPVSDFQTLALLEYKGDKLAQEIDLKIREIMQELEERYGISFGGHEDMFAEQEIFDIRADFLRKALRNGFDNVLVKERVTVAKNMLRVYAYNEKEIPSKLKLLVPQVDIDEINTEIEKSKKLKYKGPQESLLELIKNRAKKSEDKRDKMIEEGVHPKIAERQKTVDSNRERDWVNGSAISLYEDVQKEMEQVKRIVSSYEDPRDFYNDLVDIPMARELFEH